MQYIRESNTQSISGMVADKVAEYDPQHIAGMKVSETIAEEGEWELELNGKVHTKHNPPSTSTLVAELLGSSACVTVYGLQ